MIPKAPESVRPLSKGEKKRNDNSRIFGNKCERKNKNNVRIMFQNVNGLGYCHQSPKATGVRNLMLQKEVDCMAIAEVNVNWSKLPRDKTLPHICRRWFQTSKVAFGYNQHEKRRKYRHQPGGTAILTKGEMALRISRTTTEGKRLGRWTSTVIQGKQGIKTRIVSVYVPIVMSKHGHKKVSCQQQRALLGMGVTGNVMEVFWQDFWKDVDNWIEQGEQLIIAGDWNTDVTKEPFVEEFKKREMVNGISTLHGNQLPETYNNGSKSIDAIFVSKTLQIRQAGYLEHGVTLSDHRPIWIDVTKSSMIGTKSKLAPTFAARKLKTNDPRVVDRYLHKLQLLLDQHKVLQRAERLSNWTNGELSPSQVQEYEDLDKIKTWAMEQAEKDCRKLKMGAIKWSPQLQRARDKIYYYSLSKRKLLGRRVSSSLLLRYSKKTSCIAIHLTVEEMKEKIDEAYKEYKKLKKQHVKLREGFIEDLAAALESKGKGKKANIVRSLIATESQRAMFRRLAIVNQKQQDLSTKVVTVNTPSGKKTISEKLQMEKAIIAENKHKYHQTEATCPFMQEPLLHDFGELGIGPCTQEVLDGTYDPPSSVSEQTKAYIEMCKLPTEEMIVNPLTRSLEYFCDSWRAMKERTSSRTIHFGHFKAAIQNDYIMRLHYAMAEIPFRSGYSPTRWQKANNVMILKKEGDTNLERLRTLVLFEADFNHNNKFLGRSMMNHMKDSNKLASEQYSAPGRKCIDQVLNRRLYFDMIRYQKTSAAMAAADLKSCYDRVAHAPAYLAMRSFGFPSQPIESMFSTIQDVQYYTFTSHGLSDISFGGRERGFKAKPNGLGQGNGAGPAVWSIVSTKMFQVMHSRDAFTTITAPISKSKLQACGFAFVDDTDLITMSDNKNCSQDAQTRMQKVIDEWESVSKTTGGALVPKKCWCWIISFKWDKDKWEYENNSSAPFNMTVKNAENNREQVTLLPPHKAKEMLGVNLSPDGNNSDQLEVIKEKMRVYSEYIRVGHVNRYEAWTSLTKIAMKSFEYCLPAMTLTEEECKEVMKPVLKQFLPKAGINRNVKRDLLYAPSCVQGFNLQDPFITQGVAHIKDIAENVWKDTTTGSLLQCNLEQLRIEIGDNTSILDKDYVEYKNVLLTNSYVRDTWKFMSSQQISMNIPTATIPLLRENDACLMEEFRTNNLIQKQDLAILNRCRLYLKVFTVADISTGKGTHIRDEAWNGIAYDNGRDTSAWPLWGKPALSSWTKWRSALQSTFCDKQNKKLSIPLGKWIHIPSTWKWYSLPRNGKHTLVCKHQNKFYIYKRTGRSNIAPRFYKLRKPIEDITPSQLIPTTIKSVDKYYIMSPPHSVETHLDNGEVNHSTVMTPWLNVDTYRKGAERAIKHAIENNRAVAVSDGSYAPNLGIGTASWCISTQNKANLLTAGAISPGPTHIQSSYRSEILGLLGVLEGLTNFCAKWNIQKGSCTILCDGLSALNRVQQVTCETINTRQNSCDLLSACAKLKESLPITLLYAHVKGHQDDEVPIQKLSIPAQLNILMDAIAKNMLTDHSEEYALSLKPHSLSIPMPKHNNATYVYQDYRRELYNLIMESKAHDYWISDKKRYSTSTKDLIDWNAQNQAMKTLNTTKQRNIVKWCSDWVSVGKNMERWNLRYRGHCPFCAHPRETTSHVIMCQSVEVTDQWKKVLSQYDHQLIKLHTCYYLRKAIIYELLSWRRNSLQQPPTLSHADETLKEAILEQRQLGWKVFLEGLVSVKIVNYQKAYHQQSDKSHLHFSWPKKAIKAGWNMITTMWEHRNTFLHQSDIIEDLEGLTILNNTIQMEHNKGLSKLPMLEFSHLFRLSMHELMEKSLEGKKDWLVTVRLGRNLYNDTSSPDEFETNLTLRNWIGLPKRKVS